jgi:hypothetical protein
LSCVVRKLDNKDRSNSRLPVLQRPVFTFGAERNVNCGVLFASAWIPWAWNPELLVL